MIFARSFFNLLLRRSVWMTATISALGAWKQDCSIPTGSTNHSIAAKPGELAVSEAISAEALADCPGSSCAT